MPDHYAIQYTDKQSGGSHITDYETNKREALRDLRRVQPGWPYSAKLLRRRVQVGPWSPVQEISGRGE